MNCAFFMETEMTNSSIIQKPDIKHLILSGRIDSMSSATIQHQLEELILAGNRFIVVNLEQVNFLSSAGLRVFLIAQKELTKVGGEIILLKAAETVLRVFKMTGFDNIFQIVYSGQELETVYSKRQHSASLESTTIDGVTFKFREQPEAQSGTVQIIGSQEKLASSDYTETDVVTIPQDRLLYGAGLATAGDRYDEYKHLFGEALIINRHLFFYPAVKRPAVDFMFFSSQHAGTDCRFLNGFGFDGSFRFLASFETSGDFISLNRLIDWILTLPLSTPLAGIVFLAESKGIFGMNLKQIPLRENRPAEGLNLFDVTHVASWINFPVDPADHNHIIAAAGLICRDKASCSTEMQHLFSSASHAHIHAGVFAKGPISKNIDQFSDELARVLTELDITKVQHLLGQSRFSNGMLGIVELKG